NDTAIMATLKIIPFRNGKTVIANPYLYVKNNQVKLVPDTMISQNLAIQINKIGPNSNFEIGIKESSRMTPFIALKVMQFPLINLVWLGVVLVIIGFIMSMIRRIRLV
ncbi:MAG: cytochrome c assembly protein, partial [Chitinophagaceae bacterium]